MQLCEDRCPESSTLDFKRQLPSKAEQDKTEISKDVCAMANAEGGFIVYGIEEKDGGAFEISPITAESADSALRRIAQMLDSGIEPRLPSVRTRAIDVKGGHVIAVYVEPSYDGPHCVRMNNNRRFVMRNGTTTTDMAFDQIRTSFTRTATLQDQARLFAESRCSRIKEGHFAVPFAEGAILVAHFMPLVALAGRAKIDMAAIYDKEYSHFIKPRDGGATRKLNFDGLVIHNGMEPSYGYKFLFRNGCMEGVELAGAARELGGQRPVNILFSKQITQDLRLLIQQFIAAAKRLELFGAAILQCSLINAAGYQLSLAGDWNNISREADRPEFAFPPVWIESIGTASIDEIVAPTLHTLWQSFGQMACPHFDTNGTYIEK